MVLGFGYLVAGEALFELVLVIVVIPYCEFITEVGKNGIFQCDPEHVDSLIKLIFFEHF